MSPTHGAPNFTNPVGTGGLAAHPHVLAAADANDVMREQLEYLIEHAQGGACGCAQCTRYQRAKLLLLEVFA